MTQATPWATIQMLWVGGPLSTLERLSITSCLANGHPVHLYTYAPLENVPAGTQLMDANEIMPCDPVMGARSGVGFGSMAPFSNRFRYKLLLERGGIWCDTDIVLVKPLTFANDLECFVATELDVPNPGEDRPNVKATNCAMQVPAGSALMRDCYAASIAVSPEKAKWGATGVLALREQLERNPTGHTLLHPHIFCPVPYWDVVKLLTGIHTLPAESYGIHFYNEMLRRNFFDKNGTYEPHCIYERLKRFHLPAISLR